MSRPTSTLGRSGALAVATALVLALVPSLTAVAEVREDHTDGRTGAGNPDAGRPVIAAGARVDGVSPPLRDAPQPTAALGERTAEEPPTVLTGWASWYGPGFAGRRTASGEIYDPDELVAAHKTLPFGTRVRVTNQRNGRRVVVRITDRGPYVGGRIIDLSAAAASAIGMKGAGTAPVAIELT